MLRQSRREFLKAAGAVGVGASQVLVTNTRGSNSRNEPAAVKGRTDRKTSKIRVAQIKVYPEKGRLEANFEKLTSILGVIERNEDVDVVVTPEGFLDGYVSTEEMVTKETIAEYAIDPLMSKYSQTVSEWAKRNKAWAIFGCARKAKDGVFNTALIYDRGGKLAGMYDKTHLQNHDLKYKPGKHLDVYNSDFGPFGVMMA